MENFKKRLYDNELQEIEQEMELAGYSDKFICDYVLVHFQLLYENAYVENTTAKKQVNYCSQVETLTYNEEQSRRDLLEYYNDIEIFLKNNTQYKEYCYLFFENVEKLEVLIIEKLFNDYALKYDYTEKELEELNE
jgi:hypothetical protein